jgi:CHAD domain-containing protein
LHRAAKEITSALGEVRDRDVLLEALGAERAQAPATERPGLDRLIERIERERIAARLEMESFLASLLGSDLPDAVVERFGESARPPSAAAVVSGGFQDHPV